MILYVLKTYSANKIDIYWSTCKAKMAWSTNTCKDLNLIFQNFLLKNSYSYNITRKAWVLWLRAFILTGWHIVGPTMWHISKQIHPFWTCLGTRDAAITIYKNMYNYVYISWLFDFTYYFRYDNPSRVSRLLKAMNSADRGVRSKALRLVHVSTQMDPVLQVFPQVSVTNTLTITTNFHVVMVCHISNL